MIRLRRQAAIDLLGEEPVASGQPALGLDEVEEEHPGELQQGQAAAVLAAERARQPLRHPVERGLELPEEAAADGLAAESASAARTA